ncbi:DUF3047 domain-containing protein [Rhodocyclaceae bacterium SMB388]
MEKLIGADRRSILRPVLGMTIGLLAFAAVDVAASSAISPARFSAASSGTELPGEWSHQALPRVQQQNRFDLIDVDGQTVLRVRSDSAASTMLHPLAVDPATTPILSWRWKVSNPVAASDFSRKAGDDYAGRVYVLFDYPVAKLPLGDRIKISLARGLHGAELPTAAIAYVWGTAQAVGESGPNPYTDRVQMIVVEQGAERAGQWVEIRRDVAADFERVFGEPAPPIVGIAISADTDNTGESVTTLFGDILFEKPESGSGS